jgi:rod shape-determining protein MreC
MRYLFLFLKKQSFFLLFVLLELLAIILLANQNTYHRSGIINSTNAITGFINSTYSGVADYFFLGEANRQLSIENAQLRSAGAPQSLPSGMVWPDTTYRFIPARVVSNTSRNRNNYIMINKGRSDGIEKEMGLISPRGVVGIIVDVSAHYATAMSLLHKDTRISAKIKSNGQMVNVSWDGMDPRKGLVENIPTHIEPQTGDTIVTSGFSFVFPENLVIGTIGENTIPGGNLNKAELIFSSDFNRLYYVYVCKNLASAEIDSLQINIMDE